MLQVDNRTPFEATLNVHPDANGVDHVYIAVKGTFDIGSDGTDVAEEQVPPQAEDEYWGEPGESSLKYASDVHLGKLNPDIVLMGFAQVPNARPVDQLEAIVSVGRVSKRILVIGDREWTGNRLGRSSSPPELFEKMPLVWERAFGGVHVEDGNPSKVHAEWRNPAGRGFRGKRSRGDMAGSLLPNLEDPSAPLSHPGSTQTPTCFGFVAPCWQPRVSYAGTYGDDWMQNRAPYLPHDFDARFFTCASDGLVYPGEIVGGELVDLVNVSPRGRLSFRLPECEFATTLWIDGETTPLALRIETVLFEPEESRFSLVWRAVAPCDKRALRVQVVEIRLSRLNTGS